VPVVSEVNHSNPVSWDRPTVESQIVARLGVSPARVTRDIDAWLEEDFGGGDVSIWTQRSAGRRMRMEIIAKQNFSLCGLFLMAAVFQRTHGSSSCFLSSAFTDGAAIQRGDVVLAGEGDAASMLLAERVALNLGARLSGITTKTRQMAARVSAAVAAEAVTAPTLLETRKTTPGLRIYEKYATRTGGARNHRHALDTGLMLKENHLRSFSGIAEALADARAKAPLLTRIEVEVSNLQEFDQALSGGADVIMLDNFSLTDIARAIELRRSSGRTVALEVSGNLTEENIAAVAKLGVDFVSSGAVIHQATWIDMSLQIYPLDLKK